VTQKEPIVRGLVVWIAGLLVGSVAGIVQAPPPRAPDAVTVASTSYQVLAVDFHVHTFPGDGTLLPWAAAEEARRRGLDAIALTNHNLMIEWRLASAARSLMPQDVIVLPGEEVTSPGFHLAAVGIREPVRWSRSAIDVIDAVHARGGLAIAAHPAHRYSQAYTEAALRILDGVEAAHPTRDTNDRLAREIQSFYARARAVNPAIAPIGSSDFHRDAPIGSSRTFVFTVDRSPDGILDAVRAGRTAACDSHGHTTGAGPWVTLAAAACIAATSQTSRPPAQSGGLLNAFAVGCALLGLTLMVFTSRRDASYSGKHLT
jgi:hypothetical protein